LARLPFDEAAILSMRFGLCGRPHTVAEAAAACHLSAARVRRLEARALKRLRWRSLSVGDALDAGSVPTSWQRGDRGR
jgi:DNA-directed RNA polymerase sigma subunit (sigma70/sigma32)